MLTPLLECRTAAALAEDDAGRLLVRTDVSGTGQLAEYEAGALRPLTDFPEPVSAAAYVPGSRQAVVVTDTGGNERGQLFRLDLDDPPGADPSRMAPLTDDPAHVHALLGVSPDGRLVAWVSNARNEVDFDVWVSDLATGERRCLYGGGGWCGVSSGFSPDGAWLAVARPGPRPLDTDQLLVSVATGETRVVLPHPEEAALVGPPAWRDAGSCFVATDAGSEHAALVRYDVTNGATEPVLARDGDVAAWTSRDGSTLLVVTNADGSSRAEVLDAHTLAHVEDVTLPVPDAVVAHHHALPPPLVSRDGTSVTLTVTAPRVPGDVWRHHVARGDDARRLVRVTESRCDVDAAALVLPSRHTVRGHDGVEVPLFCYRPAGVTEDPLPVVLVIHGGPEGQSMTTFSPVVQGLVAAGYGVVVPNVRGSTGYGRTYASLDDTTRRLDSVADLAAVHAWLPSVGLDPDRAALWGGSYGGYMVLAGCAFQPDLWAAGVDVVGISDLVTFLENTAGYRRAHREQEYGSLAHDRDFLASASPLRHADAIRAPLFVVHGANDPRVPLSEAEQLAAVLRGRDVPCELVVYADEGHGLARLANRLDAYPRAVAFLDGVLKPG